jgi:hypothetical protein
MIFRTFIFLTHKKSLIIKLINVIKNQSTLSLFNYLFNFYEFNKIKDENKKIVKILNR